MLQKNTFLFYFFKRKCTQTCTYSLIIKIFALILKYKRLLIFVMATRHPALKYYEPVAICFVFHKRTLAATYLSIRTLQSYTTEVVCFTEVHLQHFKTIYWKWRHQNKQKSCHVRKQSNSLSGRKHINFPDLVRPEEKESSQNLFH